MNYAWHITRTRPNSVDKFNYDLHLHSIVALFVFTSFSLEFIFIGKTTTSFQSQDPEFLSYKFGQTSLDTEHY